MIQRGQKLHPSVWRSKGLGTEAAVYSPRARPVTANEEFWRDVAKHEDLDSNGAYGDASWKEVDLYDSMKDLVEQYMHNVQSDDVQRVQLDMMRIHARSGAFFDIFNSVLALLRRTTVDGRRELLYEIAQRLRTLELIPVAILCTALEVLVRNAEASSTVDDVRAYVWHHLQAGATEGQRQIARQFLDKFAGSGDPKKLSK